MRTIRILSVRTIRFLYGVAAALAVIGLGLRVFPAHAPSLPNVPRAVTNVRAAARGSATGESGGDVPSVYDSIAQANIFSRTRKAPVRPGDVQHAQTASKPTKPAGPTLTLLGTTIGPQGAVALIDTNGGTVGAELHHMGDMVAGARLVEITDSTVTLDRPAGPLVLHLQSSQHKKL